MNLQAVLFAQTLGGAIFIAVAQNIFTNELVASLQGTIRDMDPRMILSVGATELREKVPKEALEPVIMGYNTALTKAFYVGVGTGAAAILGAAVIQWRSVKVTKSEVKGGVSSDLIDKEEKVGTET